MATIPEAIRFLASRCDGALEIDGQGFNGYDAPFGRDLARLPDHDWTPKQKAAAYKMLRKYRGQLAEGGIEYDALPDPTEASENGARPSSEGARKVNLRTIDWLGSTFVVSFPYDPALVEEIRKVPGRRYRDKQNFVPDTPASAKALLAFARRNGFAITNDASARLEGGAKEAGDLPPAASVVLEGDRFEIRFPKDEVLIHEVKGIGGARWNRDGFFWSVPAGPLHPSTARAVLDFAARHGLELGEGVAERVEKMESEARERIELSRASAADFEIDGLALELYPFQAAGAKYALDARRTFIADEMGLGKTIQAIATIVAAKAYPAVVLCPASLKRNWARELRKWVPGIRVMVLEGRTAFHPRSYEECDVIVANYDLLRFVETPPKRGPLPDPDAHLKHLKRIEPKALVLDESHYCKNGKAIRTKASRFLAKGPELVLLLTGTPVVNRPNELVSQLQILGRLGQFGGWKGFMSRYCGAYHDGFGFKTDGARNLEELNEKLRATCYVRRRKAEVLPELPAKVRAELPVEITNRKEYAAAEKDAARWFADRATADVDFLAEIEGLDPEEREKEIRARRNEAEYRAEQAETLTRITALKRIAAEGKLAAVSEWVKDFLESGEKLVLFAHHREVVRRFADEFKAPYIAGDVSSADRDEAVRRFQEDDDCRLIVLNMKAGGVGLTLTAASNVAFVELGWTPADHDQAEDRCHRIGQDDSVTAWYFLAEETIDVDNYELIEEKRAVVDAATEGEARKTDPSVMKELVARLRRKVDPGAV